MTDIRKILEKQLELLQEHSNICYETNPPELTHAMLAIVDVLYPYGIPEASAVDNLVATIEVNAEEITAQVMKTMSKQNHKEILITI